MTLQTSSRIEPQRRKPWVRRQNIKRPFQNIQTYIGTQVCHIIRRLRLSTPLKSTKNLHSLLFNGTRKLPTYVRNVLPHMLIYKDSVEDLTNCTQCNQIMVRIRATNEYRNCIETFRNADTTYLDQGRRAPVFPHRIEE